MDENPVADQPVMGGNSEPTPEPAWYPDPTSSGNERLWDGSRWVDSTRVATPNRPASGRAPTGWYPDGSAGGRDRLWDGDQWTDEFRSGPGRSGSGRLSVAMRNLMLALPFALFWVVLAVTVVVGTVSGSWYSDGEVTFFRVSGVAVDGFVIWAAYRCFKVLGDDSRRKGAAQSAVWLAVFAGVTGGTYIVMVLLAGVGHTR